MRQAISVVLHALSSKNAEGKDQEDAGVQRNHTLAGLSNPNPMHGVSTPVIEATAPPPAKPSIKWQTVTRLLSMFFSFIAMCTFSAAIRHFNDNYVNLNGNGDWTDGFALVAPILSLLCNPLIVIRNLFKRRTTHHALRISLDAITFVLAVPALVYAAEGGIFWYWHDVIKTTDGNIDCTNPLNAFSYDCAPVAYRIGHLQIAGCVFLAFAAVASLALLAMGLLDLLRARRSEEQKRITRTFEMQFAAGKEYDVERGGSRGTGSS